MFYACPRLSYVSCGSWESHTALIHMMELWTVVGWFVLASLLVTVKVIFLLGTCMFYACSKWVVWVVEVVLFESYTFPTHAIILAFRISWIWYCIISFFSITFFSVICFLCSFSDKTVYNTGVGCMCVLCMLGMPRVTWGSLWVKPPRYVWRMVYCWIGLFMLSYFFLCVSLSNIKCYFSLSLSPLLYMFCVFVLC